MKASAPRSKDCAIAKEMTENTAPICTPPYGRGQGRMRAPGFVLVVPSFPDAAVALPICGYVSMPPVEPVV
jgi:hypothetical protein